MDKTLFEKSIFNTKPYEQNIENYRQQVKIPLTNRLGNLIKP